MAFALVDQELASLYGVTPQQVSALCNRHLSEFAHWKKEGGVKTYTEAGRAEIVGRLEKLADPSPDPTLPAPSPTTEPAPAVPSAPVLCRVLKLYPNPHFVRVQTAPDQWHDVKVRRHKLRPGHTLLCQPDSATGQWHCTQPGLAPQRP